MRITTTSDVVRTRPPLPAANAPVAAKSRALDNSARRFMLPAFDLAPPMARLGPRRREGPQCHLEKAQVGPPTMDPVYPTRYNVHAPIKKLNLRRKRSWAFQDSRGLSRRWLSPVPARSL